MTRQTVAVEELLADAIERAVHLCVEGTIPLAVRTTIGLPNEKFGDIACTIAMKLARVARRNPLDIATAIAAELTQQLTTTSLGDHVARCEVKPPGFLNIFLTQAALGAVLDDIRSGGEAYGTSQVGQGTAISVEFVSANPTGPLSIAHGRQAAVGDALARILDRVGYVVRRDYLLNDEGLQMQLLGQSLAARYAEYYGQTAAIPEGGYQGEYLKGTAAALVARDGDRWLTEDPTAEVFRTFATDAMVATIREDLAAFDVTFDLWTSQQELHVAGKIDAAVEQLRAADHVYTQDDAWWFRATAFGDEKDRVLKKRDGSWTYFAPDIAYHQSKFADGMQQTIDLWGPDHHGYIPRLTAAVSALTGRTDGLKVLIVQLVTLFRHGQPVPMSTRQGQFISLRELIDEVGKDAARFIFLTRRVASHLEFDLEVAKSQSLENPVYYVQYAHARICSILQKWREQSGSDAVPVAGDVLTTPEELALLRLTRQFPLAIETCARQLDPAGMTNYVRSLAAGFHTFYAKHRVVGEEVVPEVAQARVALIDGVRQVLANGLALLGVTAPTSMVRAPESSVR